MSDQLKELLIGWQEIGGYVGVSLSTLKKWEKNLDFPVKRVSMPGRSENVPTTTKAAIGEWLKITFASDGGEYLYNKGLV